METPVPFGMATVPLTSVPMNPEISATIELGVSCEEITNTPSEVFPLMMLGDLKGSFPMKTVLESSILIPVTFGMAKVPSGSVPIRF